MLGNVCGVACDFWTGERKELADRVDPRRLYATIHSRAMWMLQRQYGLGVSQVAPITQYEANGPYYCDATSVKGLSMAASFCVGALMGGRRPRTLTSIRLKDVHLMAVHAFVEREGSAKVLVP